MTKEEKTLLIKVLCEQLPYEVRYKDAHGYKEVLDMWSPGFNTALRTILFDGKPSLYLRPLPSMTESEAIDIVKLIKRLPRKYILEIKIEEDGIGVTFDDGICMGVKDFIFFFEIVKSIEVLDYLNAKHFDIRGLIPKGLAIAAVGENNPYNEEGGTK